MTARVDLEGFLADVVRLQPTPEPRLPVAWLTDQDKAAELQRIQADRARLAARENEVMLGFAADRTDEEAPPAGSPARAAGTGGSATQSSPASASPFRRSWRWCSVSGAAPRRTGCAGPGRCGTACRPPRPRRPAACWTSGGGRSRPAPPRPPTPPRPGGAGARGGPPPPPRASGR